jgi:hypothetical protein
MNSTMKTLKIPGKESAPIAYHLFPATAPTTPGRMVVFLNGMMGPQMTWHPVIKECPSSSEVRSICSSGVDRASADYRVLAISDSSPTTDLPSLTASLRTRTPQTSDHSATISSKSPRISTPSSRSLRNPPRQQFDWRTSLSNLRC